MGIDRRAVLGLLLAAPTFSRSWAAENVSYLFPAPISLPAFIPHHLAKKRGYFAARGLNVTFQLGRGGADVAKQVAVGNADVGGGVGETPIIVRPNGLKVRGVALLGSRPIFQIAVRKSLGATNLAALRGKRIGVISYEETSYYALLAALAGSGLKRSDVKIEAVGGAGMTQLMIAGALDAIMAIPDFAVVIEKAGIGMNYFPIDKIFPAMAQAVLASDAIIEKRPQVVRGVAQGILQGVRDCLADPQSAVRDFIADAPQSADRREALLEILRRYNENCYKTDPPSDLGRFDPRRIAVVEKFYLDNQIIRTAAPVSDIYTNEFLS